MILLPLLSLLLQSSWQVQSAECTEASLEASLFRQMSRDLSLVNGVPPSKDKNKTD